MSSFTCHWASWALAGSLGWVWFSLHSKKNSGASSSYSAPAEQNKIWFPQCLPDPCTQPVLADVCANISEGSFRWSNILRLWQTTFTDLLNLSPFWPRALKPLACFAYRMLWLWGRIKEILLDESISWERWKRKMRKRWERKMNLFYP